MGKKQFRYGVKTLVGTPIVVGRFLDTWLKEQPDDFKIFKIVKDPGEDDREVVFNIFYRHEAGGPNERA